MLGIAASRKPPSRSSCHPGKLLRDKIYHLLSATLWTLDLEVMMGVLYWRYPNSTMAAESRFKKKIKPEGVEQK
jgi:hypothetical protein